MRVQSIRRIGQHTWPATAASRNGIYGTAQLTLNKRKYYGFGGNDRPAISSLAMSQVPLARGYSSTSTALGESSSPDFLAFTTNLIKYPAEAVLPAVCLLSILAGAFYWVYRAEIQRRWKLLTEESWIFGAGVTMERVIGDTDSIKGMTAFQNLKLLQLNPEFQRKCAEDGWNVYSLGDYMSSLRPKQLPSNWSMDNFPAIIQREIEAGLAAALLKTLGPSLGRTLLPFTSLGFIQRRAQALAANMATNWFLSDSGHLSGDKGGIPVSLMTLLAASDLNARINSGKPDIMDVSGFSKMNLSSVEKMKAGEVTKGPSFADMVPTDRAFVVDTDFDSTILEMEEMLQGHKEASSSPTDTKTATELVKNDLADRGQMPLESSDCHDTGGTYDPDDCRLPPPVPVNPRLFPGLHLGYGKAQSSHSKREVLKMRLLSVLLNRLASNYYRTLHQNEEPEELFAVKMSKDSDPITKPSDFIKALQKAGNKVEMVPTTHLTTFGINLCVKEKDGSWSNIPLAAFLESGHEDRNGRPAPAIMPHSGLDLIFSGPLAGTRKDGTPSELHLQHFEGIEGFCGWNSNENPVVPFNIAVETGERLTGDDAVQATRVAALYATILNGLATKLALPFGGYGLTAVCNDSAALVQQVLYGDSTIYPMTSVGRFMQRSLRYGQGLEEDLSTLPDMEEEKQDIKAIIQAMKRIPNDLNATPGNAYNAAQRMKKTLQPELPFLLMKETKDVIESIIEEEEELKTVNGGSSKVLERMTSARL